MSIAYFYPAESGLETSFVLQKYAGEACVFSCVLNYELSETRVVVAAAALLFFVAEREEAILTLLIASGDAKPIRFDDLYLSDRSIYIC